MGFVLRHVRDLNESKDLTQGVFSRLLAKLEDGHIEDAEAFVFRVAPNLRADRGRRMATRGGAPLPLEGSEAMVSGVARECVEDRSPERVLLGQDALQQVLAALAELNDRTRDLYILFRLENIRQRKIASL